MNLREAAARLQGEVVGGQILCPGPAHSKSDRSLAVKFSGERILVHSYAADDWRDCDVHVRRLLGLGDWRDRPHDEPRRVRPEPAKDQIDKEARNRELARRIWRETVDPRGTITETYLANERGLPGILDDRLALTIRFHPHCPFGKEHAPALIAALRDARLIMGQCQRLGELEAVERAILSEPNYISAIQRIRLTPDGRKIGKGMSLGPMGNSCVFIGSIWENFYGAQATIAEGVETALSMSVFSHEGCVALAGAGRFRSFEPPFHWSDLTISGENDPNGASQKAWHAAGERLSAAGHTVKVWFPPKQAKDANDILRERTRAA